MAYFAEQVKSSGGFGITGSSATVTQLTDRATGVTINALCGSITTDNTSLAAEASEKFLVTNNQVEVGDVVVVCIRSGNAAQLTRATVTVVESGAFEISIVNGNVASGTPEDGAIIINFAVIKAI
jgi:hypothetical protein